MSDDLISIAKILNFHGIKGEARVGYSNFSQLASAKTVYLLDNNDDAKLTISYVKDAKNCAIVKFKEINSINDLIQYKGQRIFILKTEAVNNLQKDEYLIKDLIGCYIYKDDDKIGKVINVSTNGSQDLLNVENSLHQIKLIPFVNEFFPVVDIKNKKITIKPIEGLL